MRVLFLDLDTLRQDHLGCYGYKRNTSPNIDSIANIGAQFNNYYCPNAPCLPSRASLVSGKFGIINGVLGHGGTAADMRLEGAERDFVSSYSHSNLFQQFRRAGLKTTSISTFAERHSAYWFYAGFNECFNVGEKGMESGETVMPIVMDWLDKNAESENWLLHINFWDAHTPYRAPKEYGNPFQDVPLSDDWINELEYDKHKNHIGPHGVNEIDMWNDNVNKKYPRHPGTLNNLNEVKEFIDNYDTGIKFMDDNIGKIFDVLKEKKIWGDDLAIIITSDHGENLGELGIYGEHATADEPTCHIPMIIKWPNGKMGVKLDSLHTNVDLLPTICELLELKPLTDYDGKSYASAVLSGEDNGDEYAVLTQCAHVVQRSCRFDDYLYIRTIHGGYHVFEDEMLFDIKNDVHQTNNIAKENQDLCSRGGYLISEWQNKMMKKSPYQEDPLWTVIREGGALHSRGQLERFAERLKNTGREDKVELLLKKYENEITKK